MRPIPSIPTFAIAGQPNEGKTTVMATLAEDDRAEIGPEPGTTTRSRRYPVKVDDREVLAFFDTPGFQQPAETLEWFRQNGQLDNPAAAFIDRHRDHPRFRDEREILTPIAAGAAIIYVVDASRPVSTVDRQEIEIMRLCGNPRIAVINAKENSREFLAEWQALLSRDFNLRMNFNAHHATFADRMELLEGIKMVIQEWRPALERVIAALREDWENRLRKSVDLFVELLRDVASCRERWPIESPGRERAATERAAENLRRSVREREKEFRKALRRLFKHQRENWSVPDELAGDIFSDQVWRLFGLSRKQLIVAGGLVGAIAGGTVDVYLGGQSFFLGSVIGTAIGAVSSWVSASQAVRVNVPAMRLPPVKLGPVQVPAIRFPGRKLGGVQAEARIESKSNLLWVLVDRGLAYLEAVTSWAHGRRQPPIPLQARDGSEKIGRASALSMRDRALFINFFGQAGKANPNPVRLEEAERKLRDWLLKCVRNLGT